LGTTRLLPGFTIMLGVTVSTSSPPVLVTVNSTVNHCPTLRVGATAPATESVPPLIVQAAPDAMRPVPSHCPLFASDPATVAVKENGFGVVTAWYVHVRSAEAPPARLGMTAGPEIGVTPPAVPA
jgi:hypothetical protein